MTCFVLARESNDRPYKWPLDDLSSEDACYLLRATAPEFAAFIVEQGFQFRIQEMLLPPDVLGEKPYACVLLLKFPNDRDGVAFRLRFPHAEII